MRVAYTQPVFDEWVVVALGAAPSAGIRAYSGPRAETFRATFVDEVEPLRVALTGRELDVGDFEFALDGAGSRYDAVLKIGGNIYLICNHTGKSLEEIRANPRWRKAQAPFFQLSEKFREDPVAA